MSIRIPPKADIETRNAFQDVEARLRDLEAKVVKSAMTTARDKADIEAIREDVEKRSPDPDHYEEFRETTFVAPVNFNGATTFGSTTNFPDDANLGFISVVPDGIGSDAQRVVNLHGSLAIAPGGLSADSVLTRELNTYGQSTIWREMCYVYKTADLALAAATETDVTWDAEKFQYGEFHSTSTNTDQIVIPRNGVYLIHGYCVFIDITGSYGLMHITLNDAAPSVNGLRLVSFRQTDTGFVNATTLARLSTGDVIRMSVETGNGSDMYGTAGTGTIGSRANGLFIVRMN